MKRIRERFGKIRFDNVDVYLCMVRLSLVVADFILFWASRWVIPSVLTPSIAEMMSPWLRVPLAALLPGVIWEHTQDILQNYKSANLQQTSTYQKCDLDSRTSCIPWDLSYNMGSRDSFNYKHGLSWISHFSRRKLRLKSHLWST